MLPPTPAMAGTNGIAISSSAIAPIETLTRVRYAPARRLRLRGGLPKSSARRRACAR